MNLEEQGIVSTIEEANRRFNELLLLDPETGMPPKQICYGIHFLQDTNKQLIQTICDTFKHSYQFYSVDGLTVFDMRDKGATVGYMVYLFKKSLL